IKRKETLTVLGGCFTIHSILEQSRKAFVPVCTSKYPTMEEKTNFLFLPQQGKTLANMCI
ncbi:MAG: hypothetical protein ACK2TU_07090, partial [Anaerolineales bacterium]